MNVSENKIFGLSVNGSRKKKRMPVPYRKIPRAAQEGVAAFVDVARARAQRQIVGALLLIDGRGQPLEFVHNAVDVPGGFLWPEDKVRSVGTVALVHSLFDACQREPDLLICRDTLGAPEFCRDELAPTVPFAQVTPSDGDTPAAWSWINDPPAPGMRAHVLYEHLARRGFVYEPFARLDDGLRLAYLLAFAPSSGSSASPPYRAPDTAPALPRTVRQPSRSERDA